jgi:4-methyl-5(b-hydroxyethyl)-thiazole monophosphate biosynthesis
VKGDIMATVAVILAEGFEEIEAIVPIDLIRRAGIGVDVISIKEKMVRGAHGISLEADKHLYEVKASAYDAVFLPGGMPGSENLAHSSELSEFLLAMSSSEKLISAICAAPAKVLAPLGITDERAVTGYPGFESGFDSSSRYTGSGLELDRNVLTSKAAGTAHLLAGKIIESISGPEKAKQVLASTFFNT